MYQKKEIDTVSKAAFYDLLARQLEALLQGERDAVTNMANTAALLFDMLDDVNWCGFYRNRDEALLLGPFCGRPACVHIAMGKGVCGTSAQKREALVVPDVRKFPGHIACDGASRSEVVLPIVDKNRLIGVLDIDSPTAGRFDDQDRLGLEAVIKVFLAATDFTRSL